MKKIYTLLTAALAIAGTATAQQLPGGTFNGDWETCYPNAGTNAVGEQPANWGASNVYQMMSFELVTQTRDINERCVPCRSKENLFSCTDTKDMTKLLSLLADCKSGA